MKEGKIKVHTCVDGSWQQLYIAEEDVSSLIVSTKGLLLTAAIDMSKNRFIAICDITFVFLKTDMEEIVLIVLHNDGINALIQANTKYREYVKKLDNSKYILYVEL